MPIPTNNASQTINLILVAIIGFLLALLLSDHSQLLYYLANADFVELSRRAGLASIYIFVMMLFGGLAFGLMYCIYKMITDDSKPNQELTLQFEEPQELTMPKEKSEWINVSD
jgi:hypothetical protein